MMKLLICLGMALLVSACQGGKVKRIPEASVSSLIVWRDTLHDFGSIPLSASVDSFDFRYRNTGKQPLVVLGLRTSCHCTVATYDARPVQPGDSSYIRVTYDGRGRQAEYFEKSVQVYTNASERPQQLVIRGKLE